MRWLALTLLAFPLAVHAAPTTREAVRNALEAPRTEPLSAEAWRWLGDDADVHLVATARDARVPLATRLQAVWALGTLGGQAAHTFFSHVVATEDVEPPVLAAVVETFAQSFRGPESYRAAASRLSHAEPVVRSAAARALERLGRASAEKSPAKKTVAAR